METKKPEDAKAEEPEEGENDWFFDIIINFLRSPRWKTPIMSFLDEYCIIFDSEDENKLEYTPIHSNFKKLVEETFVEHKNKMNKLTPMQDYYYLRDRVDLLEK